MLCVPEPFLHPGRDPAPGLGAVRGNTYREVTAGALLYVVHGQAFPELDQGQPVLLVHVKHSLWKSRK